MAAVVLTALGPVAHAQTAECHAGVERAATAPPLLVQPIVHGEQLEVAAVRYIEPSGPLYIDEPALAGWGIATLNAERQKLSQLKGGGIARLLEGRDALELFISDVPRDDTGVIGSGLL